MNGIRMTSKHSEHHVYQEIMKELRRHRSSTRTLHHGNGGIRTVGITHHGVRINGSHRRALVAKSTDANK